MQSPIIKDYLGRINIAQSPQIVSPTVSIQNIGVSVPLVSNAGPSCSQGAHVSGNSTPVVAQAPSSGQIGLPQKSPAVNVIAGLLQQIVSSSGSRPSASLSQPSVLVQPSPRIEMSNLFWVMFLTGNISRCQGCGGRLREVQMERSFLLQMIWWFNTRSRLYFRTQTQALSSYHVIIVMFITTLVYFVYRENFQVLKLQSILKSHNKFFYV